MKLSFKLAHLFSTIKKAVSLILTALYYKLDLQDSYLPASQLPASIAKSVKFMVLSLLISAQSQ